MLPILHSEEQLDAITAVSFPHVADHARRDVIRRLSESAAIEKPKPVRPTPAQLAAIGITITTVSREEWESVP